MASCHVVTVHCVLHNIRHSNDHISSPIGITLKRSHSIGRRGSIRLPQRHVPHYTLTPIIASYFVITPLDQIDACPPVWYCRVPAPSLSNVEFRVSIRIRNGHKTGRHLRNGLYEISIKWVIPLPRSRRCICLRCSFRVDAGSKSSSSKVPQHS